MIGQTLQTEMHVRLVAKGAARPGVVETLFLQRTHRLDIFFGHRGEDELICQCYHNLWVAQVKWLQ